MSFNMDDYVDVAERIRLAKEIWPDLRFQPANPMKPFEIIEVAGMSYVVYCAALFRDANDVLPAIGIAWEPCPGATPYTKGSELMNAETSAWGRAVIAAGIPSKKVASKDEIKARMSVVKPISEVAWETPPPPFPKMPNSSEDIFPKCKHGAMKEQKGEKNGREFYGFTCHERECPAQWWMILANGQWGPKVAK
jgi:hypothetical protein